MCDISLFVCIYALNYFSIAIIFLFMHLFKCISTLILFTLIFGLVVRLFCLYVSLGFKGQIHKALTPTYLKLRGVIEKCAARIFAPDPQNEIHLKTRFFRPT